MDMVIDRPMPFLLVAVQLGGKAIESELVVLAIQRVARNDPRWQAAEQLTRLAPRSDADQTGWAWPQIG